VAFGAALLAQQASPPPQTPPPAPSAQVPPVTFKVEINYVEVDAIVSDERGTFVPDLEQSDFQVLEEGKPQKVSTFALVHIPIERAEVPLFAKEPIEPDVRTNEREFDGRLYVLALDDLHTHPLRSLRVKQAARQFIERRFGANDLAAVVHLSGRSDASQDFTSNRRLLVAAVDKFMGRKVQSATLGRISEYFNTRDQRQAGDPVNDPNDFERGYQARQTLSSLKSLAEWMSGIRGRRKALVFISEGIDYNIYDVFNARDASTILDEARDAIAAATRGNVSIYGVDPRGLTSLGDEAIEIAALPDDTSLGLGVQSLQSELRLSQDSLRTLSDETGGFAVVNANDMMGGFDRIVRDNSSYYILGYYPANDKRDGRFRKLEVRVNRPGLQVRARKGYVAPRGRASAPPALVAGSPDASAAIREVLNNPLPVTGLSLAVFAAPFKGVAPNASVAVTVEAEGADLKFAEKDGKFVDKLEISIVAVDAEGKSKGGDGSTLDMDLKPETFQRVSAGGFRMLSRLQLPPGRYQLRVAGRETGAGKAGSVVYDLEVPDFFKMPITMSGIVLTAPSANQFMTARPDEHFKDVLPGPPTARREFSRSDTLALFAEVYDNEGSKPHQVEIATTVRVEGGTSVFQHREERASSELGGARGGYGYTAQIPLKDVSPGLYVLRVEARSRLRSDEPVSREIMFRVR
jgi:VWFA-related protein